MKNLKKYTAPMAETIKVGMTGMCCTSIVNDHNADSTKPVLSKEVPDWVFMEEDED